MGMKFHNSMPIDRRVLLTMLAGSLIAPLSGTEVIGQAIGATGPAPFSSNRLRITRRGTLGPAGRDIVLIPGLASGPSIWNGLAGQLSGHRLHLVHVAGFAGLGAGANATGPMLSPLTAELARYISSRPMRQPTLIGHSMGGTLAMMLALRHSRAVNRIMVVDMLPEGAAMLGGTAQGVGYLASQLNGYFTGTKAGRQIFARMLMQTPGGQDSDPRVIAQALTELAEIDLTSRLKDIACPLEVVYALPAERDMATDQSRRYRQAYAKAPRASLVGIGPGGHMLMIDQPEKFASTVRKFLK